MTKNLSDKPRTRTLVGRVRVYQRDDGKFAVKWPDWTGKWKSTTKTTYEGAMAKAQEIHAALDKGRVTVNPEQAEILRLARQLPDAKAILQAEIDRRKARSSVTVGDLCAKVREHYDQLAGTGLGRVTTARDAASRMTAVERGLGEIFLDSLTGDDVVRWLESFPGSARNRSNNLQALRNAIRLAKAWRLLPAGVDPTEPDRINASNMPHLLRSRRQDPTTWTRDQFDRALEAVEDPRHRMFLVFGGCLGLRPSETQGIVGERDGLTWDAIDWDARTITVGRDLVKTARPRVICFRALGHAGWTQETADLVWSRFERLARPYASTGPVCPRGSQDKIRDAVRGATGAAWQKDALRHTWISALLGLGVAKEAVARLAGNSVADIENNYEAPMGEQRARTWFE